MTKAENLITMAFCMSLKTKDGVRFCINKKGKLLMDDDDFIIITISKQKNIALIAHDSKKRQLVEWCRDNQIILAKHNLCGTGATASLITHKTGLNVKAFNSGPLCGDQQIEAKIVEGQIDLVIFFSDPLGAQPHDPDVKALLRIAQICDIPIANNGSTADFIITSIYMNSEYEHKVINNQKNISDRIEKTINSI